ncbi:serine/threonine-protein kinase pkn3 isoform X2 [Micropterus dolomieu]|uniref:serine/threonine-protein kinase pkn3 isoform X2 n=1 Tax=Micropterus dolomieu TaxID=147949 RepID=UPI001E8CC2EE|nr:serine/threonine-protein kinase pkn3 isoform X2 [Micropterus dolomieu]
MAYSTNTLAQGCFGKVYKQKYNDTWAAVKKVPQQLICRKDLERECEVYNKANHPNIVKLLGNITLQDGKWIIPLEFIFGEDLETTIFKTAKSKIQMTPANKGTIIVGMCEGLLHLHSKDIVHQDLKPENIMVEHNTNRAVIIDLGLAKFFRHGLNSAIDMGNEAYSAPEVLQRCSQRDQRSDVWAMGKIIAELCARIRLYTPSVCPAKIKETLQDQPYCHAVCRMVEPDPTLRASIAGVISEIRKAADAGSVTTTAVQKDQLKAPAPQINVQNRDPSPVNRGAAPLNRDPLPVNRGASPLNRDPLQVNRGAALLNRDPLPVNRGASPLNRDPLPVNRGASPLNRDPLPVNRGASPLNRDPLPVNRGAALLNRDPSPVNRGAALLNRDPLPVNRGAALLNRDPLPVNRGAAPLNRDPSPFNRDPVPLNRTPSPFNQDPSPLNKFPSPLKWERSPRPDIKVFYPDGKQHLSPPTQMTEDKSKNQALVPMGGADLTQDFMKMKLFQEAARDLPCNLPTTGRVVMRRFEEKNGEMETWEQKEVVTRDGKIVKFDDVKFNSK